MKLTKMIIGLVAVCMFFVSQSVRADTFTFDFVDAIDDTDSSPYDGTITMFGGNGDLASGTVLGNPTGERGGTKLVWAQDGLTLTVTAAGSDFVYLDENWTGHGPGGLGVTSILTISNQANPSSDDNVSLDEILQLDFGVVVVWDLSATVFRDDNHSIYTNDYDGIPDGMRVRVDSHSWQRIDELFASSTLNLEGQFFEFQTIDDPDLNKQFYISSLVVSTPVPEPTTIALLGIGLVGLAGGAIRRRFKKQKQL